MNYHKLKWLLFIWLLFFVSSIYAELKPDITLSEENALKIAIKIWFNESNGSVDGLTVWNQGENFASMGIGHFIWYPANKHAFNNDSFSQLIQYFQNRGIFVPKWLKGNYTPSCPWIDRTEFLNARYTPAMIELRAYLVMTIPWQAQFMVFRLDRALTRILMHVPADQREYLISQFNQIAKTPQGVYALIDYVNFKGDGAAKNNTMMNGGSGLLQVLNEMHYAPPHLTPLQAFTWSADRVLTRRVEKAPPNKHEWRWLAGWRKRIKTYTIN